MMGFIQKIISGLSDTGKKLMAVALIVLLVALFDRLLISPTMSKLSSIDQEITKEENVIRQDLRFLRQKDRVIKQAQAYEPFLTEKILSDDEMIAAFLKRLEVMANKANVTIIKVTPSSAVKEEKMSKLQADLECSGNLTDVVNFMHLLEISQDLMKISKYSLGSKKSDTDEVKATMTVVKAVIPAKDQPVSSAEASSAKTETPSK